MSEQKMTDLRKAAEMALITLEEKLAVLEPTKYAETIEALRQALAQPEWVGLTDEDVTWLCNTAKSHEQTWGMFVRTVEAKLKEKNT